MKCKNCGTEYQGKFCPECGLKNENLDTDVENSVSVQDKKLKSPNIMNSIMKIKDNKQISKKLLIVAVAVILIIGIFLFMKDDGEKFNWDEVILAEQLPKPPTNNGSIISNSEDNLSISIESLKDGDYKEYVDKCKEIGFTIDYESDSNSYEAYNKKGYKLRLSHYGDNEDMHIDLNAPIKMTTIKWPTGTAGSLLPVPNSSKGKFSYEYEDHFSVFIGDTSFEEYNEYIEMCKKQGFTVDYNKDDKYYSADNSKGWHISVTYEGFNTMLITIDQPEEDSDNGISSLIDEENEVSSENQEVDNGGIDPNFKAAMDSYEQFINEYISFMKKYSESNGTDLQLITDYTSYLDKYTKAMEDFSKWKDEELNDAETKYYLEVQARVSNKLIEAGI